MYECIKLSFLLKITNIEIVFWIKNDILNLFNRTILYLSFFTPSIGLFELIFVLVFFYCIDVCDIFLLVIYQKENIVYKCTGFHIGYCFEWYILKFTKVQWKVSIKTSKKSIKQS